MRRLSTAGVRKDENWGCIAWKLPPFRQIHRGRVGVLSETESRAEKRSVKPKVSRSVLARPTGLEPACLACWLGRWWACATGTHHPTESEAYMAKIIRDEKEINSVHLTTLRGYWGGLERDIRERRGSQKRGFWKNRSWSSLAVFLGRFSRSAAGKNSVFLFRNIGLNGSWSITFWGNFGSARFGVL